MMLLLFAFSLLCFKAATVHATSNYDYVGGTNSYVDKSFAAPLSPNLSFFDKKNCASTWSYHRWRSPKFLFGNTFFRFSQTLIGIGSSLTPTFSGVIDKIKSIFNALFDKVLQISNSILPKNVIDYILGFSGGFSYSEPSIESHHGEQTEDSTAQSSKLNHHQDEVSTSVPNISDNLDIDNHHYHGPSLDMSTLPPSHSQRESFSFPVETTQRTQDSLSTHNNIPDQTLKKDISNANDEFMNRYWHQKPPSVSVHSSIPSHNAATITQSSLRTAHRPHQPFESDSSPQRTVRDSDWTRSTERTQDPLSDSDWTRSTERTQDPLSNEVLGANQDSMQARYHSKEPIIDSAPREQPVQQPAEHSHHRKLEDRDSRLGSFHGYNRGNHQGFTQQGQQAYSTPHTQPPTPTITPYNNWQPLGALASTTVTQAEREALRYLRQSLAVYAAHPAAPAWYQRVTDVELLRFLRARKGDTTATWNMINQHVLWRSSALGPDSLTGSDHDEFSRCPLNQELYWAGEALDGCPTVIIRTAAHDVGAYENEYYIRFVVWMLEIGRQQYGVGTHRQVCVIVDRSPLVSNGEKSSKSKSITVMLPLLRLLFSTLQDNYPELLFRAFVAPVNWIFWTMYSAASGMIDENSRKKITMVRETEFSVWWQPVFPPNIIPRTIGGVANYPNLVDISYGRQNRHFSAFPQHR